LYDFNSQQKICTYILTPKDLKCSDRHKYVNFIFGDQSKRE
jgi:hypothetical protein